MYGALDISTSGMIAQRTRLDVVTANTVNQDVIRDAAGNLNPYRRRDVLLATGGGGGVDAVFAGLGRSRGGDSG